MNCRDCKQDLPVEAFYKGGRQPCKACYKARYGKGKLKPKAESPSAKTKPADPPAAPVREAGAKWILARLRFPDDHADQGVRPVFATVGRKYLRALVRLEAGLVSRRLPAEDARHLSALPGATVAATLAGFRAWHAERGGTIAASEALAQLEADPALVELLT